MQTHTRVLSSNTANIKLHGLSTLSAQEEEEEKKKKKSKKKKSEKKKSMR